MPRYTKQRDKYSCGPIVILNAIRWTGAKMKYRELRTISKACNCIPDSGTAHRDFDRTIRQLGEKFFTVRRVYHPKLKEVEKHLKNGGAVILNYMENKDKIKEDRHFQLTINISKDGKYFDVVNAFYEGPARQTIFRNVFRFLYFRRLRSDESFKAWFLTKKEK